MTIYEIASAWRHKESFLAADDWIKNVDEADWYWKKGSSHINGTKYPAAVCFKHAEDYLVFKLKFVELLKFP